MIAFVKKYRERTVLTLIAVVFFALVGGGIYLQKQKSLEIKLEVKPVPSIVELELSQKHDSDLTDTAPPPVATSFYLKPLPGELMEQIANLTSLDERVATGKFSGLPVMWEVHFFSLQAHEDNIAALQLDVSEDGFGVMVICDVDIDEYPDITEVERGEKIWVAGEIVSVDPSGTGTVYLKTRHLRFTLPPTVKAEGASE